MGASRLTSSWFATCPPQPLTHLHPSLLKTFVVELAKRGWRGPPNEEGKPRGEGGKLEAWRVQPLRGTGVPPTAPAGGPVQQIFEGCGILALSEDFA